MPMVRMSTDGLTKTANVRVYKGTVQALSCGQCGSVVIPETTNHIALQAQSS